VYGFLSVIEWQISNLADAMLLHHLHGHVKGRLLVGYLYGFQSFDNRVPVGQQAFVPVAAWA
jgi:hypothetical protein